MVLSEWNQMYSYHKYKIFPIHILLHIPPLKIGEIWEQEVEWAEKAGTM